MPKIMAVSGIKNSGKTTFISRFIPRLKEKNIKVGVIKHDGHDFEPDVEGTDSFIHRRSGADGVAIYSKNRWMLIEESAIDEKDILKHFVDYDLVILEGFKYSAYPKIEIIRKAISQSPVADKNVLCYVTDLDIDTGVLKFDIDDIDGVVDYIYTSLLEGEKVDYER